MTFRLRSAKYFFSLLLPFTVACGGGDDDPGGTGGTGGNGAANEWNGKTYMLTIARAEWTEPRSAIQDIAPYVPQFLLQVNGTSADSYSVTVGTARNNVQDMCNKTVQLTGSGNAIGPAEFPMHIRHTCEGECDTPNEDVSVDATIRGLTMTDALPTAGVVSDEGKFSATMDARDVSPLFTALGTNPTADDLCDALTTMISPPAPCEPCPHDSAVYCLTLMAEEVGATEAAGVTIQPVTTIGAECEGGLPNSQ